VIGDIKDDGCFRTYKVKLSDAESYRGAMSYLFVRPTLKPEEGGFKALPPKGNS
jgi:hypothetical protein